MNKMFVTIKKRSVKTAFLFELIVYLTLWLWGIEYFYYQTIFYNDMSFLIIYDAI